MPSQRALISREAAQAPLLVGIDVGGTNLKIGLVDDRGRTLAYHTEPTLIENGPEDGARRMGESVRTVAKMAGVKVEEIRRVGLATPGTMDVPAGMFLEPHNLPGWDYFPIRDRVAEHAGLPVTYANDANAAAYGEYWVGSGDIHNSMILLTLGTGIGGGIIINDQLIVGEQSHGGEVGHIIIDYHPDARRDARGFTGRLEPYASATGLVNRTNEELAAGAKSSLSAKLAAGEELTPILIGEAADGGDEFAMHMIMDTAMYLGVGVVSLMHTIDPNIVVLGGAMTFGGNDHPLGRKFIDRVRQEVQLRAFPIPAQKTKIEYATLGGDAGYLGAAGLARIDKS